MSYVDLNRCGVALMEIVSKPDIRDAEQAKAYVTKLRSILRYLGTCDGDMEKGSLRADVNVSVRKPGGPLGTRCEIKNMNSITFIGQAIEYEARRQIEIIEDGGTIDQETRLFDPNKGETRSMRSKEEAHDYRYFPDPDLLPLEFTQDYVDELKAKLPELPDQKKARFIESLGLSPYDAGVLVAERESAVFYETVLEGLADRARDGKLAAQLGDQRAVRASQQGRAAISRARRCRRRSLAAIVDLIGEGTISGKIAKDLFEIVWTEGGDPRELVEARGMKQVTDLGAIEKVVDDIIAANPDKVAQAKAEAATRRLVRRPGDEAVRRQGQSASGQRSAEGEARHLSRPATGRLSSTFATRRCARASHRSVASRSKIHHARRASARCESVAAISSGKSVLASLDEASNAATSENFFIAKPCDSRVRAHGFFTASLESRTTLIAH